MISSSSHHISQTTHSPRTHSPRTHSQRVLSQPSSSSPSRLLTSSKKRKRSRSPWEKAKNTTKMKKKKSSRVPSEDSKKRVDGALALLAMAGGDEDEDESESESYEEASEVKDKSPLRSGSHSKKKMVQCPLTVLRVVLLMKVKGIFNATSIANLPFL